MTDCCEKIDALSAVAPAEKYQPVTKADADLPAGTARGLLVGTAGTATLMGPGGEIRTDVPLQPGYNPLRVKQVRLGGTAADIWALY
ncbi:MAG: spike base protein, RCAP_Rcc01079 family [Kiloniellales bacterium]